ncbi:putative Signal transduction histidine kinase [Vibrio nigripulchritudo SO65]|uniref:ATP-binding protein n=1 Tax=Vibrio nigripulchritudo TaxID=28173 RepID=UPI0003B1B44F|nr:ATP-binding protein [Vibrio nigripulchritudo]CCN35730.1 putative Signal transduction histidine kinase [Vibrio nigripulchritudo AM115]CCN43702.1 putative Signal transduction histidine kinase [Vibrio nigripulchritudo FTn2]CCN65977.1 putative Signal transduction histidine kinase [Vibrio nigripulchritudo POn4]CCN78004.1 putative Signal transduction histidine kinase [Vibrio nigripulchritudo SO65]
MRFRWPNSLVARTLLLTLLAVVVAQGIATSIWYSQSKQREYEGIRSASESMANMFASTVTFFQSLPREYRHIVLDQIRNMGGTRFFVSFNEERLDIDPVPDSKLKRISMDAVEQVLSTKLRKVKQTNVEFSRPDTLRILKNDIYLSDLPRSWAHHTLTLEPLNPPILVVQIELDTNQWLYIAALLPAPYISLDDTILGSDQVLFLVFSTTLLLLLTYLMVKRQVRPLRRLAKAANDMSIDVEQSPLAEEGAEELITATRAFNRMQSRINRYITDREHLFSAISHDLKTPITRLRIRAELLESDRKRFKFNRDLDELEMMVKGALQCVRETDLHENNAHVDLGEMLESIAESHNQETTKVFLPEDSIPPIWAKPLAMKRVLTNLIDNGVKYGHRVHVYVYDNEERLELIILDEGKGIPESKLDMVFEPYYRLANDKDGHGLGLGISRNILHAHGGDLIIYNSLKGGLEAKVLIPHDPEL